MSPITCKAFLKVSLVIPLFLWNLYKVSAPTLSLMISNTPNYVDDTINRHKGNRNLFVNCNILSGQKEFYTLFSITLCVLQLEYFLVIFSIIAMTQVPLRYQ